ncbi:tetratricopeptide repeat protein [Aliikangiella sp. IMCC44653]
MINLWLASALILIFSLAVVAYYAIQNNSGLEQESPYSDAKWPLLFPFVVMLLAPIYYFSQPSYQAQQSWQNVKAESNTLLASGNINDASVTMQQLILALRTKAFENPESGTLWYELGQAYANLNMRELALEAMQRAVRVEPNPDWQVATAQLYLTAKTTADMEQAKQILTRVVKQNPEHQGALLTLGFTAFHLKQYPDAIAAWQQLVQLESLSDSSKRFIKNQIEQTKTMLNNQ